MQFVSPLGGQAPMDGFKADDAEQIAFLADNRQQLEQTMTPQEVDPSSTTRFFSSAGTARRGSSQTTSGWRKSVIVAA